MILSKINAHSRDKYIEFYDRDSKGNRLHHYYVHGYDGAKISVTTLAGNFFKHFNSKEAVEGVLKSKKMEDPEYKYYGMTKDEILKSWNSNEAANLGTHFHEMVELFYNGCLLDSEVPDTIEFQYFLMFFRDFNKKYKGWKPYRTEMFVWTNPFVIDDGTKRMITGSIDMTFINDKGEIAIFDWKRVKDLTYLDKNNIRKPKLQKDFDTWNTEREKPENKGKKIPLKDLYGRGPVSHINDSKYHHYSLQLNIYKYILETYYDKKVVMMKLVVCTPTEDNYLELNVEDMQEDVKKLIMYPI
jgi:hypothetical protein